MILYDLAVKKEDQQETDRVTANIRSTNISGPRRTFLKTAGLLTTLGFGGLANAGTATAQRADADDSRTFDSDVTIKGETNLKDTTYASDINVRILRSEAIQGVAEHIIRKQSQLESLPNDLEDGDTVLIGNVKHSEPINIDGVTNVTISGIGKEGSSITTATGANCGLFHIGHNSAVGTITIKNLMLDGNNENQPGGATTANPIWTQNVDEIRCEDVFFKDSIVSRGSGGAGENTSCARVFYPTRKATFIDCDVDARCVRGIESSCEELHVMGGEFKNTYERCISLDALVKTRRVTQRACIDGVTVTKGEDGSDAGACVGGAGLRMQEVGDEGVTPTGDPIEEWVIENCFLGEEDISGKRTGITIREFSGNGALFKFRNNVIGDQNEQGILCKHTAYSETITEDAEIVSEGNRAVMSPGGAKAFAFGNARRTTSRGDTAIGKGMSSNYSSEVTYTEFEVRNVPNSFSLASNQSNDEFTARSGEIYNSSSTALRVVTPGATVSDVKFIGQHDNEDCIRIDGAANAEIRDCIFRGDPDNPGRHGILATGSETTDLMIVGNSSREGIAGNTLQLYDGAATALESANL